MKQTELTEKQKTILALECKRHQQIYLLHLTGMKGAHIARAMGTNGGHVGNVLKGYKEDAAKCAAAQALMPADQGAQEASQ